jgi:hypothetical protein
MICACGHEFGNSRAHRPAGPLPGSLGCFVWLFVVHANISLLMAWACTHMKFEDGSAMRWLPAAQAGFAILSFIAAWGLYQRRKWALNLGAVIMVVSIPLLPHGVITAIIVITGMSKERHLLD